MSTFRHFSRIYFAIFLILLIVGIGTGGFMWIEGYSILNAFYTTIITVATVGFLDIPLSDTGKLFTAFLIITSFGTFAYAVTAISKYLIDGEFNKYFKNLKLLKTIDQLNNHVIICGYGRNGRQAAHVLKKHSTRFVVIEKNKQIIDTMNHRYSELALDGDATFDETLLRAGIKKAKALITTLPVDADNLFIVLSARALNPKLTIISRASEENSDKKLKIAGANNVIMPDKLGGAHMASLVMKPDVLEFVDYITGQGGDNIRLEQITFETLAPEFRNKSISELEIRSRSGANIIGFKTAEGDYIVNPSADTVIIPDVKLFVLGTGEQINRLREMLI